MGFKIRRNNKADNTKYISYAVLLIVVITVILFERCNGSTPISTDESIKQAVEYKNILTDQGYNIIHFMDVGQGDCTLIETTDKKYVLIDASTQDASNRIQSYLKQQGVTELEYVIFTHPHEDHIGCGDEVLENFTVKNIIMTKKQESTASFERLIDSISESKKKHDTKVFSPKEGDTFMVSDTVFTVISDPSEYEDLNNSSICLKVECGESTFIFTGDAEKQVEEDILESGFDIDAEVYKCGHHGSSTSNTEDFIDAISPDYAIVSCGKDNSYGHPHVEVVSALKERNIRMLITHEDGDILIGYNKDSIVVK